MLFFNWCDVNGISHFFNLDHYLATTKAQDIHSCASMKPKKRRKNCNIILVFIMWYVVIKYKIENICKLISFWQKPIFAEARERTISPETSVSSCIVEATEDSIFEGLSFAQLSQVVFNVKTFGCIEHAKSCENTLHVTRCNSFWFEDTLLIFSDKTWWNTEFSNTFFSGSSEIFTSFDDVFSWSLRIIFDKFQTNNMKFSRILTAAINKATTNNFMVFII